MTSGATHPIVDLIFDTDCPNIEAARSLLTSALSAVGLPIAWREWLRDSADTPAALRGFGSPTILVDGVDVSGATRESGQVHANSCRIYDDAGVLRGVPPFDLVARVLTTAMLRV